MDGRSPRRRSPVTDRPVLAAGGQEESVWIVQINDISVIGSFIGTLGSVFLAFDCDFDMKIGEHLLFYIPELKRMFEVAGLNESPSCLLR